MTIGVILKTLKNVYENSNFYKEVRIVSFVDRLLQLVATKIKQHCGVGVALKHGVAGTHTQMLMNIDCARHCCNKFI